MGAMSRPAIALGAALLLAVAAHAASRVRPGLRWGEALGAPWLVVAFAVGALVGARRPAARWGAAALALATVGYYAIALGAGIGFRAPVALAWLGTAAVAGAAFALAGAAWRTGAAWAAALPAGALAGEALLLTQVWDGRAAAFVLGAELAAGLLLPFVLVRRAAALPAAVGLTLAAALVLGLAEAEVREALRAAGWRGL